MISERPVEISGSDRLVRRGMLGLPTGPADTAVLFLPSGLKYRAGSHRLNVRFARRLNDLGYATLRFDPAGLGESDGHLSAARAEDIAGQIEAGLYIGDIRLAVDALREQSGARQVVVAGLCGGAISAVLAAGAATDAVQGVISMGLPVVPFLPVESGAVPQARVARRRVGNYVRKLISTEAWGRVLRGESDFRGIGRNLRGAFAQNRAVAASPQSFLPDENPRFIGSFRTLEAARIPHLMIFGSSDNRWIEFESTFLARELSGSMSGGSYAIELVPHGSHEFHFESSKVQAGELLEHWMNTRFPLMAPMTRTQEASHDAQ